MYNLHELQPLAHANARAKGFYDDRDLGDETRLSMTALTHSEISEALECVRKNELQARFKGPSGKIYDNRRVDCPQDLGVILKPVGLPSEVADIVIRALDFAYFFNIPFAEPDRTAIGEYKRPTPRSAAAWLAGLHQAATDEDIGVLIQECYNFASAYGFDLDEVVLLKHQYNTGRSVMHGGKQL